MASLTGQLVAETYKALLKLIDNDILTASEKQITDGFGGGSNVFIDSQGFLRANKYKVTNGLATQFLKADGSLDANSYLTSITGAQVITALGYTPVTNQRTLTINGVGYNLTADRTWTIEGTAAVWGNITGTLSNQTDLQNALNAKFDDPTGTISQYIRGDGSIANFPAVTGFVPYTGATDDVDLGDYALYAHDLVIDHSSASGTAVDITKGGSGIAVNITKTGSGEALTVVKSSGSGNAASITGGVTLISELNLTTDLADAYIASAATWNAKQAQLDGTGFVKASGTTISYDNSTYLTTGDAASTYQRLDKMVSNLLASDTEYPNSNAVIAALALKANAANPVFTGNMTISGAEPKLTFTDTDQNPDYFIGADAGFFKIYDQTAGATRFQVNSDGNISTGVGKSITAGSFVKESGTASQFLKADGSIDSSTYVSTSVLADYLLSATAASTYQRLDKMVSNLLASDTEYPNSNAVLAKLALKADAANPVFTGNMTISGAEPKLYLTDTDQNPDYFIGVDAGYFRIYNQTAGQTKFVINSDGDATFTNSVTASSIIKSGGTSSQFLMADGSVSTLSGVVTGSGTTNYLPKWTSASGLGNSIVSDNGTTLNVAGGLNTYGGSGGIKGALYFRNTWNNTQYPTLYSTHSAEFIMIHLPHIPYLQNSTYGYGGATYGSIIRHAGQSTTTSFWDSGILGQQNITDAYGISRNDGAPFFYIASTGNINIGAATDAGYKLNVNGSVKTSSILSTLFTDGYVTWEAAQFNRTGGFVEFQWAGSAGVRYFGNTAYPITFAGLTGAATFSSSVTATGNIKTFRTTGSGSYLQISAESGVGTFESSNGYYYFNRTPGDYTTPNLMIDGANNRVGIGTPSPLNKLQVRDGNLGIYVTQGVGGALGGQIYLGDVNFDNSSYFNSAPGIGAAYNGNQAVNGDLAFYAYAAVANSRSERMRIQGNTGNVGIGTTNPGEKFEVNGSIKAIGRTVLNTSVGGLTLGYESGIGYLETWNSSALIVRTYNYQSFNISGTQALKINTNRNILINTDTDPGYNLYVNGQIAMDTGSFKGILGYTSASWGGSTQYPTLYGSDVTKWIMHINPHISYTQNGLNGYSGAMNGATIRFASDWAASYYWDIGIGVCSVGTDKFAIGRNGTALLTMTNSGSIRAYKLISGEAGLGAGNYTVFSNDDNVGYIDTVRAINSGDFQFRFTGTTKVTISTTGNVTATAFFESSDSRLKKLIEHNPIVAGIENLEAKLYEKDGKIEIGYFAQDAELIMPYAVTKGSGGFLNLSYREIHTAKIARLEKEVAELKEKLNLN